MKWHQLGWLVFACTLSITPLLAQHSSFARGIVVDLQQQKPLTGAHVLVQHANEGVTTDSNGFFQIRLYSGEDTLLIRYPGFESQLVPVAKDTMRIELSFKMGADTVTVVTPETYEETYQIVRKERSLNYSPYHPWQAKPAQDHPHNLSTEDYSPIVENNERQVLDYPTSTFSIDVDRASYSNVRRFLEMDQQPPIDAVRIEELINYFEYDYPEPKPNAHPISVYTEISDCPWNSDRKLLHIGLKGRTYQPKEVPPSNLVFLMDISGSMGSPNKLPLAIKSLKMLVEKMQAEDRIAIVVYAGAAGLVLPSTAGSEKERILQAIGKLKSGGSTAGGAGIKLAYKVAQEAFIKGGNNRIILTTDGDFNVGVSSDGALYRLIEEKRASGVYLTVLGFGMGNLKDNKMELLADHGNGNYAYIDNEEEARRTLVEAMNSTLHAIAKDVKIQLEFNPAVVRSYRLVGYENRMLEKSDFENDQKDAGEMGAGHTVTALYELEMRPAKKRASDLRYQEPDLTRLARKEKEVGYFKLRYKLPEAEDSKLIDQPITNEVKPLDKASTDFRFAAAVAAFGLQLRGSVRNEEMGHEQLLTLAETVVDENDNKYRKEFLEMVRLAAELKEEGGR